MKPKDVGVGKVGKEALVRKCEYQLIISPKWSKLSKRVFGNSEGKHCHWCKYIKSEDGESRCTNKLSKFCDGDRIRTWDGEGCAKECGQFKINKWYTDDKNFDAYFNSPKEI